MKYSFIIWTIFIKWPAIQFHAGPPSLITENCELITSSSKFLENDSYSAFGLKTQKPPSALQKEAHGRGTTLTFHSEYRKGNKKALSIGQGRSTRGTTLHYTHIHNGDSRLAYFFQHRCSRVTRCPSIPVPILPALCDFQVSLIPLLAFEDIIISEMGTVKRAESRQPFVSS